MTATTIKVQSALRDQLKEQARTHGRTLGDHLQALADGEARRERFLAVQRALAAAPPDDAYRAEARDWASDAWN
jgi:hypothetical protein